VTRPKRIAILTGGGDCPGLNAVIRAVARTAWNLHGWEVYGVRDGAEGLLAPGGRGIFRLDGRHVAGILPRGGTILGASNRCNLFEVPDARGRPRDQSKRALANLARHRIACLVVVGGDGSQRMAARLMERGQPVVGVPKTIDNDVKGTDVTFGFDTAVSIVTEAIDRLYTTAESHHRVMLVEVMGRDAGWIALGAGMAGGAEVILIPEIPYDPDRAARPVRVRMEQGKSFSIVVVSEGARRAGTDLVYRDDGDEPGGSKRLGGVSLRVAQELRERLALDVRTTVLGHVQRGGTPTARDRALASWMGGHAVGMIAKGRLGHMVALRSGKLTEVPLEKVADGPRRVPRDHPLLVCARELGICFAAADGGDDEYTRLRHAHGRP
jgi:6-phosphofructokinase 1